MKLLDNGNVSMDNGDLDVMRSKGYDVSMHTVSYVNGITVALINGDTVGFHCWLDNLEFYVGNYRVAITSQAHLDSCITMMDSILAFGNYSK